MKTNMGIGVLLLTATLLRAQTNDLTGLLQQGLFEEQANRNLDAAITDYQSLAVQFDKDRQLAATAVFRLGECYRAQGRTNEAVAEYQRILRDFPDQQTLATLSRQNLAGLGLAATGSTAANATTGALTVAENPDLQLWKKLTNIPRDELKQILPTVLPDATLDSLLKQLDEAKAKLAQLTNDYSLSSAECMRVKSLINELNRQTDERIGGIMSGLELRAHLPQASPDLSVSRQQQREFLAKQIALAEEDVADMQNQYRLGLLPQQDTRAAESKVLELRQRLASLDSPSGDLSTAPSAPGSDEDQEIQRVKQMIQTSPDLINAASGGSTPLVKAAYNGWQKVAAYLLDHGADVNLPSSGNTAVDFATTPLVAAVVAGNKAMTQFLIDRGANVNFKGPNDNTALHLAARKGFQAVAEVLLASHADVNAQDAKGMTPLLGAVQNGQLKIAQTLIAAGANVNLKDSKGQTALSCFQTSPEICQALLNAGADPNTVDADGRTPLSYAVERNSVQMVKLLLAAKADPNALFYALDKPDLLQALLNAGAKVDARRSDGHTPLDAAVTSGFVPAVRLLLKYHADANDAHMGFPVIFAATANTNILEALLDSGANIESHDQSVIIYGSPPDWTPLAAAAWGSSAGAVECLLRHGANPNVQDADRNTPLHWALSLWHGSLTEQNREIVQLLLDHKANPNLQDARGNTPLDLVKRRMQNASASTRFSGRVLPQLGGNNSEPDPDQKAEGEQIMALLHQHGALDHLPVWDCITVSRPSANFSYTMFRNNTNGWNRFTLLELLANFYEGSEGYSSLSPRGDGSMDQYQLKSMLPFADLAQVAIVRPSRDSTNETRFIVNLLNNTNGIDCSKDVSLSFGDVVEIPERDHSLGENAVGLTDSQLATLYNYVKGTVRLVAHGQTA
ncbi:MAG TPA: ankyrin repeat domain-containing protein, partial [Candidatus Acidoferrales bacterium]|nr:ankyrin repeat domain-containing protein [Candidatus Acidoferrales bacterium]